MPDGYKGLDPEEARELDREMEGERLRGGAPDPFVHEREGPVPVPDEPPPPEPTPPPAEPDSTA